MKREKKGPRKKIITICSSASFYREVLEAEKALSGFGFKVKIPETAKWMKKNSDFDPLSYKTWMKNPSDFGRKTRLIDKHFKRIMEGDVVLVINHKKHGLKGYIGGNVLMEMAIAHYHKKPIFILNPVSKRSPLYEEVLALMPHFLEGDLTNIKI